MGQTYLNKEAADYFRQRKILDLLMKAGSASSEKIAQELGISRGQIIKDIAALRKTGHPRQTGSMTTENGMYVVTFELMERRHRKAQKSTSATSAE